MRRALAPIIGLGLLACAKEPEPVLVAVPTKQIEMPVECTSADPKWADLPDADVKQSVAARTWRINKDNYNQVIGKRKVCRAAKAASK